MSMTFVQLHLINDFIFIVCNCYIEILEEGSRSFAVVATTLQRKYWWKNVWVSHTYLYIVYNGIHFKLYMGLPTKS